jgi:hypothetical protein
MIKRLHDFIAASFINQLVKIAHAGIAEYD